MKNRHMREAAIAAIWSASTIVAAGAVGIEQRPLAETPRLLVDASKDGGVYSSGTPYQGYALAQHLRSRGYALTELTYPLTITPDLLAGYDVVVRTDDYLGYDTAEIAAYLGYVAQGGRLLLLSEYQRAGRRDVMAESFGIVFRGVSLGENRLDRLVSHPITAGVSSVPYGVGSGIFATPMGAEILGYLSAGTYLDLNDDGFRDASEPGGMPALGRLTFGAGEVVFCGDTNLWLMLPQPLVDNTFDWLTQSSSPAAPQPAAPVGGSIRLVGTSIPAGSTVPVEPLYASGQQTQDLRFRVGITVDQDLANARVQAFVRTDSLRCMGGGGTLSSFRANAELELETYGMSNTGQVDPVCPLPYTTTAVEVVVAVGAQVVLSQQFPVTYQFVAAP